MSTKDVARKEIRFAWHIPKTDGGRDDLHYVREDITYKDGTTEAKCFLTKDYQRPVWVTTPAHRSHNEKKEFEEKDKLICRKTTESDLNRTVAGLLEKPHWVNQPDQIKNSPYVYGYDITSTSLIKLSSLKRNDFVQTPYGVAASDIETNPITGEILMITIAYKNKTYTALLGKFVKNIPDVNRRIKAAIEKYLPKYSDLDYTVEVFDDEVEMIRSYFRVANEWAPVLNSFWNMDFDIPTILGRLKHYNVNPVDVVCDQRIPRYTRVCRYRQGTKRKVTASGVVKPVNPSLQWHTLIATTSFYVIDAMCVYRQLRISKQEEPSYSLDAILKKELNTQKLKFTEADAYSGLKWHLFMQANYPIEYIVYHLYDCLSMLELEDKTKDLSSTLPAFAGITDFQKFNSQVRKISDALFLFGLEKGLVIGTAASMNKKEEELYDGPEVEEEEDDDEDNPAKYTTLDLKGWIQLLPQNLLIHNGLRCLEEYPDVVTNVRGLTYDLDSISSYPSCTMTGNVSKATCVNEIIEIKQVPEDVFREHNLSMCLGPTNMLDYFHVMFGMMSLDQIDAYLENL